MDPPERPNPSTQGTLPPDDPVMGDVVDEVDLFSEIVMRDVVDSVD